MKVRVGVVDVHYFDAGGARAALIVYSDFTCSEPSSEHIADIARAAPTSEELSSRENSHASSRSSPTRRNWTSSLSMDTPRSIRMAAPD